MGKQTGEEDEFGWEVWDIGALIGFFIGKASAAESWGRAKAESHVNLLKAAGRSCRKLSWSLVIPVVFVGCSSSTC
ncbi:hypothetical protein HPP92_014594 [Vanilla planifolia]|uniref:Uncharacterized protein n=1 Tax=Vanilla planifolia TaxID=51239 RepID=A0A835QRX6_VANPL|nr:hypothetical protein HPP92_014594 [Vanilla planifolia]